MAVTIYLSLAFLALYLIGLAIHRWFFWRAKRTMAAESRDGGRVIAKVGDLAPGQVKKFWVICQKYRLDGFLINDRGSFHAYVNRCRHMPTPLDFVRDEFISETAGFCGATRTARSMSFPRVCASTARARESRFTACRCGSTAKMFWSVARKGT
jgi:hypothetical protein